MQVWICAAQSSRRGDGLIQCRVDAARARVDQLWQRVNVSALELRYLAILKYQAGQVVFRRKLFEQVATSEDFEEFLTIPAYDVLVKSTPPRS